VSTQLRAPCRFRIACNPDDLPLTVPGDFRNLSSAAHALRACATLRRAVAVLKLGAGEHVPRILDGVGPGVDFTDIDGLIVRGAMTEDKHLTLHHTVIKGSVMLHARNLTLEGLRIESATGFAVGVSPIAVPEYADSVAVEGSAEKQRSSSSCCSASTPTLRMYKCHVNACAGFGVVVGSGAHVELERCRLSKNFGGLAVSGRGSAAVVKHCTVVENQEIGICVQSGARCVVTGYTQVKDNGKAGAMSAGVDSVIKVESGVLRHNGGFDAVTMNEGECVFGANAICDKPIYNL
jgi:hypothetical protein